MAFKAVVFLSGAHPPHSLAISLPGPYSPYSGRVLLLQSSISCLQHLYPLHQSRVIILQTRNSRVIPALIICPSMSWIVLLFPAASCLVSVGGAGTKTNPLAVVSEQTVLIFRVSSGSYGASAIGPFSTSIETNYTQILETAHQKRRPLHC